MIYDPLKSIPAISLPEQEANAAGIVRLRLVPDGHLSILKPVRFPHQGLRGSAESTLSTLHLFFTPGASVIDVGVMPDYASFSEETDNDSSGRFFRPLIQIAIPKVRPEMTIWLTRYQQVKWIAFLQDRNGFCRCVGTPDQPLTMSFGQSAGSKNGRNQTSVTFSASVEQPAYYLTGIDDEDLVNGLADFDESFGIDFNV